MRINEILWRSAHECETTFGFRPIWGCAEIGFLEDHLLLIGCFKELQHTAGHMVLSTLCSIISFKQHPIASESLWGDGSTKSKTLYSWYILHDDSLLTYHIPSNSRMWVLTGRLLCWYNMKKMKKWESCFTLLCRGSTLVLLGHIIARWALQPTPAYPFTRNKLSNPSITPYEMLSGWLNAREIYQLYCTKYYNGVRQKNQALWSRGSSLARSKKLFKLFDTIQKHLHLPVQPSCVAHTLVMLHTFRLCAFQDPPLANCHSILATTSSNLAAVLHLESWKMLSSNPCHVIMFSIHQGSEASWIKMCHSMSYLAVSLIKKRVLLCYKVAGQNAKKTCHILPSHCPLHASNSAFSTSNHTWWQIQCCFPLHQGHVFSSKGAEITNMTVRWQYSRFTFNWNWLSNQNIGENQIKPNNASITNRREDTNDRKKIVQSASDRAMSCMSCVHLTVSALSSSPSHVAKPNLRRQRSVWALVDAILIHRNRYPNPGPYSIQIEY